MLKKVAQVGGDLSFTTVEGLERLPPNRYKTLEPHDLLVKALNDVLHTKVRKMKSIDSPGKFLTNFKCYIP
jgi:hypothetical protein